MLVAGIDPPLDGGPAVRPSRHPRRDRRPRSPPGSCGSGSLVVLATADRPGRRRGRRLPRGARRSAPGRRRCAVLLASSLASHRAAIHLEGPDGPPHPRRRVRRSSCSAPSCSRTASSGSAASSSLAEGAVGSVLAAVGHGAAGDDDPDHRDRVRRRRRGDGRRRRRGDPGRAVHALDARDVRHRRRRVLPSRGDGRPADTMLVDTHGPRPRHPLLRRSPTRSRSAPRSCRSSSVWLKWSSRSS